MVVHGARPLLLAVPHPSRPALPPRQASIQALCAITFAGTQAPIQPAFAAHPSRADPRCPQASFDPSAFAAHPSGADLRCPQASFDPSAFAAHSSRADSRRPQASFDPPGLTISVKKDRAMEPLLMIGNNFAVSMVAEGKEKAVMKRWGWGFGGGKG